MRASAEMGHLAVLVTYLARGLHEEQGSCLAIDKSSPQIYYEELYIICSLSQLAHSTSRTLAVHPGFATSNLH